jgi:HSP90 family molecular chaperone
MYYLNEGGEVDSSNIYVEKMREMVFEQEKFNEVNKQIKQSLLQSIKRLQKSLDSKQFQTQFENMPKPSRAYTHRKQVQQ